MVDARTMRGRPSLTDKWGMIVNINFLLRAFSNQITFIGLVSGKNYGKGRRVLRK